MSKLSERDRKRIELLTELEDLAAPPSTFTPENVLHAGQIAVALCAALTVVICAGRRWGKSVVACFKAFAVALANPGVTCCLIGATQGSISRIFWRTLRDMNRVHGLGAVSLKGVEGWSMTLPNGSQVVLLPVDSVEAADKVRGLSNVAFVCVDESQRYRADVLRYLLLDVIKPMFIDLRAKGIDAQLWLMGTPNPIGKVGTFWEYMSRPGATVFTGTVYDNAKLGTRAQIEAVVDEMLAEAGETKEGSWYQREILARWVVDIARRVYHFDDEANAWPLEWEETGPPRFDHYALIGDIGVRDADAVGRWAWNDGDPTLVLVSEHVKRGQDTLGLGDELRPLIESRDDTPVVTAFDGGGLGLKVIMTLQKLFPDVPMRAVVKPPVNLQVKALNDRMVRGFKVSRKSQFYAEVRNSEWVDGIVNGKIQETGHSDVVPMARYAAVELANLLPDAPVDETPQERDARERHEAAQRAERNRRASQAQHDEYEQDEFSDDLDADLGFDAAG
ncbi:MAG TPA: hypothetical protein VMB76_09630 [Casimicrobiaceae bacterium]|nr:hypothetical protein [Casimicrobiaceae bacterium]